MIHAAAAEPLEAQEPPEVRGADRADVALLVATRADGGLAHARFGELGRFLRPGDLLVVNTSATLPAALPARLDGDEVLLHLSTPSGPPHDAGRPTGSWSCAAPSCCRPRLPGRCPARAPGRRGGQAARALPRQQPPLLRAALARRADGATTSAATAEPIRYRHTPTGMADRRLPDGLRDRPRQRRDAERGAAVHRRAGGGAVGARCAVRAGDAARRRVLARAGREPVPGALSRAGGDSTARERRAWVGRPGDRRGHHGRARARDGRRRRPAPFSAGERPHEPRRDTGARPARDRRPHHRLARAELVAPAPARGGRGPRAAEPLVRGGRGARLPLPRVRRQPPDLVERLHTEMGA